MDSEGSEAKYYQHPFISQKCGHPVSRSHVIGPRQSTRSTIVIHRRQLSCWARVKQPLLKWTKAVIKILGLRNFSLREHLFYSGILLVMTVIVILCFVFVKNNKSSQLSSSAGLLTQYQCPLLANPRRGLVHISGTMVGDVGMYECDKGYNVTGDKTRVCQDNMTWSGTEPKCRKNAFCVGAPVIPNGGHDLLAINNEFPLETVLKYTCNTGHQLNISRNLSTILVRLPHLRICSCKMFSL